MIVLWLSHFVPFPPKGGCFQRSYHLIRRVSAEHDIHLLALRHKSSIHPAAETRETLAELRKICRSVDIVDISDGPRALRLHGMAALGLVTGRPASVTVYRSAAFRRGIDAVRATVAVDVVHFDTIGLAQYLDAIGSLPAVMTHHGAEAHMIRRRIPNEWRAVRRAYYAYEWLALRAYERRMCPRFVTNIVVSDDDRRLLADTAPGARFTIIPNGVDTQYFTPGPPADGPRVVFAGRLDQYANRHGMLRFMDAGWPALQARIPDVSIDIIGSNPPDRLRRMHGGRVRVHGFVPDVRPFFRNAAVAVCPLWDGGGTRIKVLDALAQGTPVVATPAACEGLALVPGQDVLLGDSPQALADAIARLLEDEHLRRRLSARGRATVERLYSWDSLAPRLSAVYRQAMEAGPAPLRMGTARSA